jgi:uncharacterized delta-60 repeat protein
VAGKFTSYRGQTRNRVAAILWDGQLDTSFNPRGGPNGPVTAIVVEPNYKVIIGGMFTSGGMGGGRPPTERQRLARLNRDGTLDTTFDPGPLVKGAELHAIALQPDGKILVGGNFSSFIPTSPPQRRFIIRLLPDGRVDTTFNGEFGSPQGYQYPGHVKAIVVLPDNKILIGGKFPKHKGNEYQYISRLNPDGSPDSTFTSPVLDEGQQRSIDTIAVTDSGRILIGGAFRTVNGKPRDGIARLSGTGNVDSFRLDAEFLGGFATAFIPLKNSRVLVAGGFHTGPGTAPQQFSVALLESTGKRNKSFVGSVDGYVTGLVIDPTTRVVAVVGEFKDYTTTNTTPPAKTPSANFALIHAEP